MTITIVHPPIVTAAFVRQPCDDSEYFRKYKPGTNDRYSNDDDLGHNNYHLGYDYNRLGTYPDTLYAVCDGIAERIDVDFTGAFGQQIGLRNAADGYSSCAFYAHCETRIADGTHVKAGQPIGRMGTTGGVPEHLHFSWLGDWRSRNTWRNPGPQLRALRAKLTVTGGDDLAKLSDAAQQFYEDAYRDLLAEAKQEGQSTGPSFLQYFLRFFRSHPKDAAGKATHP